MAFLGVNKATALYRLNDDFFALFTPETPLNPGQNGLKRRSKMPKIWEKPHFSPLKSYVSMAYMAICLHFLKKPSPARSAGRTYIDQASCFFRPIPFIFISNEKWNPTVIFPKIFGQKTPYGTQKFGSKMANMRFFPHFEPIFRHELPYFWTHYKGYRPANPPIQKPPLPAGSFFNR